MSEELKSSFELVSTEKSVETKPEPLRLVAYPEGRVVIRTKGGTVGLLAYADANSEKVQDTLKEATTIEVVPFEEIEKLDNGQELISKIMSLPNCPTC